MSITLTTKEMGGLRQFCANGDQEYNYNLLTRLRDEESEHKINVKVNSASKYLQTYYNHPNIPLPRHMGIHE